MHELNPSTGSNPAKIECCYHLDYIYKVHNELRARSQWMNQMSLTPKIKPNGVKIKYLF